jgi:hypothetical protein
MKMPAIRPTPNYKGHSGDAGLYQAALAGNLLLWQMLEARLMEAYRNANKRKD